MSFVVDASLALAWFFEDEGTGRTAQLLDRVVSEGIVVPSIWRLEMLNAFRNAVIRRRIPAEKARGYAAQVGRLSLEIDAPSEERYIGTFDLALAQALSIYDAAYLELALHRRIPLASDDRTLRKAAASAKVVLL